MNQQSNVVYNWARGVGTERADEVDSCFPVLKMPMGLIEYATNFFIAKQIYEVLINVYLK